jgi:hypothetical protein
LHGESSGGVKSGFVFDQKSLKPIEFATVIIPNDIDKMIKLKISASLDNILRLFYVIKGSQKNEINLSKPIIPKFKRKGFVVAEWGVVLK